MNRLFRALLIGVATVCVPMAAPWAIAAPYAAIVMDMRDGSVMHSRGADRRQHPASLTKMMTLYLAFEAVENGQIGLDTRVRISRKASRTTGSRLWLKAGERVKFRHLIRAAAIKSANDAAVAIAEAVAGSEKAFAARMTEKARELGMSSTTYKNAHGLTRAGHLSTARDQARLARHLFYDFPEYYNIFSRRSDRAAGRRIRTTNRLLGAYRGMSGIKTGYTRAAGYNLVGTARRGNEHIIAVVMGGKSSRTRNRRVAELLTLGFKRAKTHVAVVRPGRRNAVIAHAPVPKPKPVVPATVLASVAAALVNTPAQASTPPQSATTSSRAQPRLHVPIPRGGVKTAAVPARTPRLPGAPVPRGRPDWSVDLGSYADKKGAMARRARVARRADLQLDEAQSTVQRGTYRGRPSYQVIFGGLTAKKARAVCAKLSRLCHPIPPQYGG